MIISGYAQAPMKSQVLDGSRFSPSLGTFTYCFQYLAVIFSPWAVVKIFVSIGQKIAGGKFPAVRCPVRMSVVEIFLNASGPLQYAAGCYPTSREIVLPQTDRLIPSSHPDGRAGTHRRQSSPARLHLPSL